MPNKEAKRLYDIEYRRRNRQEILNKKRAYNKTPAGRAMQKRNRDKLKDYHLSYCRSPEYRVWKNKYDRKHRAKNMYGEFWECMLIVDEIEREVRKLVPDKYERLKMSGYIGRMQARQAWKRHLEKGWAFNWTHVLNMSEKLQLTNRGE